MTKKPEPVFTPTNLFGGDGTGCWFDLSDDAFTSRDEQGNWLFHDKLGNQPPWVVPADCVHEHDGIRYIEVPEHRVLRLT